MPSRDYLVAPTPMPMLEATRKGSPRVCEALAWHGLLDPAPWVRSSEGKGLHSWGHRLTWIHQQQVEVGDADPALAVPTRLEKEKARRGEEWEQGPQATERLLLWAMENQPPPKGEETAASLASLAIHHCWRFALQHLVDSRWIPPHFLKPLLRQVMEAPWPTGACILASALAVAFQPDAPNPMAVVRTWGGQALSPEALDGLLLALPAPMRLDEDLWEGWALDWFKALAEKPQAFSMIQLAADRFEAIRNPSARQRDVLRGALELLVASCPPSQVRKYARRYVRVSKAHGKGVPEMLPALAASLPSDGKLSQVQKLARRAAVCHDVLEKERSSDPSARSQQAKLYWVQVACCKRIRSLAPSKLGSGWGSSRESTKQKVDRFIHERESRLDRIQVAARFDRPELFDALLGMQRYNGAVKRLAQAVIPDWMDNLAESESGWQFLSESMPSGGSRAAHLLRLLPIQEVPWVWMKRFGLQVAQGRPADPAIGRILFSFSCKPTTAPSKEFQEKVKSAWETRDMEVSEHRLVMVAILSTMAEQGILEIQDLLDPENLDCLGVLYPNLLESQLERSLPPASPAARPPSRL